MKYIYLLFCLFTVSVASALLPDGSNAPNWTLTDMNGVSHTLYDALDDGKSVVIDFSTTWCPPCWNYHTSGTLETVYNTYGPDGTDEVRVYFIESDDSTNDACMEALPGCTGGTQGNWLAGTNFPMFNPPNESVPNAYQASSYPTLIAVCPNRKLYDVGQVTVSTWASWLLETCSLGYTYQTTDAACYGDEMGSITLDVSGGFGSISYSWSNGETSQNLTGLNPGTYSCTITEGRGHSVETVDIVVAGPTEPVVVLTDLEQDILCNGANNGMITVSGQSGDPGFTYLWSNGETTNSISNLPPNTYTVTVTDGIGCEATASYVIDEPTAIIATTSSSPEFCDQGNGTATLIVSGGTPPYTYTFQGVTIPETTVNDLPTGTYTFEAIDANNCVQPVSVTVNHVDAPLAAVEEPDYDLTCANNTLVLDGSGSASGTFIVYSWSTTDGNIVSGETTRTPTVDQAGTYVIQVTDVQTNCVSTAEVVVVSTVELPNASAGPDASLDCSTTEVTLDGSNSDAGATITYLWTTTDGNIVEGDSTTSALVNGAGTYVIEVTNTANGCASQDTVVVTQSSDVPTAQASEPGDLTCIVSEITIDAQGSSTGTEFTYEWTTTDGNIVSGATTLTPVVDQAGTYTLRVLNTTNNCEAFTSAVVEANQLGTPITLLDVTQLTCEVLEVPLSVEVPANYTDFNWTTANGNIVSDPTLASITVNQAGSYTLVATSSSNGCTSTIDVEVSSNDNTPSASFSSSVLDKTLSCVDESQGENNSYLWDFGDGNTSTEKNPSHTYAENGTFTVCLTVTNECGSNTSCEEIKILKGSSLDHELVLTQISCSDECDGAYKINLANEEGNYEIQVTGPNGFNGKEAEGTKLCAGEYTYTITNEAGDQVTGTFILNQPTPVSYEVNEVVHNNCFNDNDGVISIEATGGTAPYTYLWSNDQTSSMITNLPSATYTCTITDANNCTMVESFVINEPNEILLDETNVTQVVGGLKGAIDITVSGGTSPYTFKWSNGETTEDISGLDPGNYSVVVTDANGCETIFGPIEVKEIVGTHTTSLENQVDVYPNPANNVVTLSVNGDMSLSDIEILNHLGETIEFKSFNQSTTSLVLSTTSYDAGIYFFKFQMNSTLVTKKFVVLH